MKKLIALALVLFVAACASSAQPSDLANRAQLGEGNKDSTAAMFGSVATSRREAKLSDRDANGQNGGEVTEPIVLWNPDAKKWEPQFGADGKPLARIVRGFRDYWNFNGSTITQSVTGSGTTSGSQSQAGTQSPTATPTNNPNIPVNVSIPATGGP